MPVKVEMRKPGPLAAPRAKKNWGKFCAAFSDHASAIIKSFDQIERFQISIYFGKEEAVYPAPDKLKNMLFKFDIHPKLAADILNAVECRMIKMHNDRTEIDLMQVKKFNAVRDNKLFWHGDIDQRIKLLIEAKIIEVKTVTPQERAQEEAKRKR